MSPLSPRPRHTLSTHRPPGSAPALADALPNAQHRTLDGQTHAVAPEALAPVLAEFFA